MTKLQVGAQMYSVRDYCQTVEKMREGFKAIKEIGYNTCQMSGYNREIPVEKVRELLDEAGLTCACTHGGYYVMEENLDEVIREHQVLGCQYPGIGGLPSEFHTEEGYIEFAKRASKVADKLADHGMHFIYHNHAFELYRFPGCGKSGLELLFENSSPNLQFELDMFWVQRGGASPLDWIEKVRGRMDIAHFKEMNGTPDNGCEMAPIGAGNMNWTAIMKACDDIGVKYAMVEQDNAPDSGDSLGCMAFSYNTLKKLGARF